jgi:hypothetical protein
MAAVNLRADYSAGELRRMAATTRNANQSRGAVLDGMNRTEAARVGGMDRQTLRLGTPLQRARSRRASGRLVQRSSAAFVG